MAEVAKGTLTDLPPVEHIEIPAKGSGSKQNNVNNENSDNNEQSRTTSSTFKIPHIAKIQNELVKSKSDHLFTLQKQCDESQMQIIGDAQHFAKFLADYDHNIIANIHKCAGSFRV